MKKTKDITPPDKAISKKVEPLNKKPALVQNERKPEQFEEDRSMRIRMKPQPLTEPKGKTDK